MREDPTIEVDPGHDCEQIAIAIAKVAAIRVELEARRGLVRIAD